MQKICESISFNVGNAMGVINIEYTKYESSRNTNKNTIIIFADGMATTTEQHGVVAGLRKNGLDFDYYILNNVSIRHFEEEQENSSMVHSPLIAELATCRLVLMHLEKKGVLLKDTVLIAKGDWAMAAIQAGMQKQLKELLGLVLIDMSWRTCFTSKNSLSLFGKIVDKSAISFLAKTNAGKLTTPLLLVYPKSFLGISESSHVEFFNATNCSIKALRKVLSTDLKAFGVQPDTAIDKQLARFVNELIYSPVRTKVGAFWL